MSELEKYVMMRLLIKNITVHYDTLEIIWTEFAMQLLPEKLKHLTTDNVMIMDLAFIISKGSLTINLPEEVTISQNYNKELIKALSRAFKYQKRIANENISIRDLAIELEIDDGYLGRLLRLTYLAPDIIKSILAGTQPQGLLLQQLIRKEIPAIWAEQRKLYNFI